MEIWLKHPVHGTKCAYLPTEAENDEKNGWVRVVQNVAAGQIAEKQAVEQVKLDAPADIASEELAQFIGSASDAPKKRGPKPKNQG